jgi:hypothetical protein
VIRPLKYLSAVPLLLASATACYRYTPIPAQTVPMGENVRVFVTRSALLDLEDVVDVSGTNVRGRVVRQDNNQLFLRVPVGARQVGFHSEAIEQEIPIPVSEITQVERREFNRMGTGAFIAGGLGATAVVLFLIIEAYGEPEFVDECEDCVDLRVPLLSIPFHW